MSYFFVNSFPMKGMDEKGINNTADVLNRHGKWATLKVGWIFLQCTGHCVYYCTSRDRRLDRLFWVGPDGLDSLDSGHLACFLDVSP